MSHVDEPRVSPALHELAHLIPSTPQLAGLAALLVLLVVIAGLPSLDAPWLPGDEHIFIVRNALVNPEADALAPAGGLAERLGKIAGSVHEDLYQPLPMMAYALEWQFGKGLATVTRRTDVAIHALNALLVWIVLARMLIVVGRVPWTSVSAGVAWAGAVIWALHPVLASTYAADMGRTHLLSATFSLLALVVLLRMLGRPRDSVVESIGVLALLLLAMLSKPVAGWVLPAFILYAACRGVGHAFRAPLVWLIGALCVGFAVFTVRTSADAGLIEDASKGLFGDPVTRSAVAAWLYIRHTLVPTNLQHWYPPDPSTGWGYWPVWIGLAFFGATAGISLVSWRRTSGRHVGVGWAWFWGHMLPVIGLVAAREAAATDRYLYQPLVGAMAIAVIAAARRIQVRAPLSGGRLSLTFGAVVGVVLLLITLVDVRMYRSPLLRVERVANAAPGDPRAYEALAAAYTFARNRPLPADDAARVPAGATPQAYFGELAMAEMEHALAAPQLERYFPGIDDRAPFHRRLSYQLLRAGRPDLALEQANVARELQPDSFNTWRRLAQAYRALERPLDAAAAYERAEALLPEDSLTRRVHYAEYGDLLVTLPGRDQDACAKFAAALRPASPKNLADPAVWRESGTMALLGAARCHIRFGQGADGFEIARQVLAADPTRTQAWLVIGEYHLRSQHFEQAIGAYGEVVRNLPAHYEALRGYHEALFQAGRLPEAVAAWQASCTALPGDLRLMSFLAWAAALADDARATELVDQVLATDSNNPFACLAQGLVEWRRGEYERASQWVERAAKGRPVPDAREFERAVAGVRVLRTRGALPDHALVLEAVICANGSFSTAARRQAASDLELSDVAGWPDGVRATRERVLGRLSDVQSDRE